MKFATTVMATIAALTTTLSPVFATEFNGNKDKTLLATPSDSFVWDDNVEHQEVSISECKSSVINFNDAGGWIHAKCDQVTFSSGGNTINLHWIFFNLDGKQFAVTYVMDKKYHGMKIAPVTAMAITQHPGQRVAFNTINSSTQRSDCRIFNGLLQCIGFSRDEQGDQWGFVNTAKLK